MRIAIAGVGVAGGVIATGLAGLPGVEVLAFEKVGPDDHAAAGNGLNVGPNALLALQNVLPEMAARLRAASLPWRQWRAATMAGEPLYEVALQEVAQCEGIRIRWAELYRACRERTGGVVRFNAAVTGVRQVADGGLSVTVHEAGGAERTVADIDLLIAADGRYSVVREQLSGSPEVTHLGVGNFRVLLQRSGAPAGVSPQGRAGISLRQPADRGGRGDQRGVQERRRDRARLYAGRWAHCGRTALAAGRRLPRRRRRRVALVARPGKHGGVDRLERPGALPGRRRPCDGAHARAGRHQRD